METPGIQATSREPARTMDKAAAKAKAAEERLAKVEAEDARKKAKPKKVKPEPAEKTASVKGAPAFTPMEPPASPVSSDKATRLAELLRKYKADEITPEEYHQQRAKILAEP